MHSPRLWIQLSAISSTWSSPDVPRESNLPGETLVLTSVPDLWRFDSGRIQIRTSTGLRIRIQLFSLVAFEMSTKNKSFFLLMEGYGSVQIIRDPDPGSTETCGSYGSASGSGTLVLTVLLYVWFCIFNVLFRPAASFSVMNGFTAEWSLSPTIFYCTIPYTLLIVT